MAEQEAPECISRPTDTDLDLQLPDTHDTQDTNVTTATINDDTLDTPTQLNTGNAAGDNENDTERACSDAGAGQVEDIATLEPTADGEQANVAAIATADAEDSKDRKESLPQAPEDAPTAEAEAVETAAEPLSTRDSSDDKPQTELETAAIEPQNETGQASAIEDTSAPGSSNVEVPVSAAQEAQLLSNETEEPVPVNAEPAETTSEEPQPVQISVDESTVEQSAEAQQDESGAANVVPEIVTAPKTTDATSDKAINEEQGLTEKTEVSQTDSATPEQTASQDKEASKNTVLEEVVLEAAAVEETLEKDQPIPAEDNTAAADAPVPADSVEDLVAELEPGSHEAPVDEEETPAVDDHVEDKVLSEQSVETFESVASQEKAAPESEIKETPSTSIQVVAADTAVEEPVQSSEPRENIQESVPDSSTAEQHDVGALEPQTNNVPADPGHSLEDATETAEIVSNAKGVEEPSEVSAEAVDAADESATEPLAQEERVSEDVTKSDESLATNDPQLVAESAVEHAAEKVQTAAEVDVEPSVLEPSHAAEDKPESEVVATVNEFVNTDQPAKAEGAAEAEATEAATGVNNIAAAEEPANNQETVAEAEEATQAAETVEAQKPASHVDESEKTKEDAKAEEPVAHDEVVPAVEPNVIEEPIKGDEVEDILAPASDELGHEESSNVEERAVKEQPSDDLEPPSQAAVSEAATEAAADTEVTEPDLKTTELETGKSGPSQVSPREIEQPAPETASEEYVLIEEAALIPHDTQPSETTTGEAPAADEQATASHESTDSDQVEKSRQVTHDSEPVAVGTESFQIVEGSGAVDQSTESLQQVSGSELPSQEGSSVAEAAADDSMVVLDTQDSQLVDEPVVVEKHGPANSEDADVETIVPSEQLAQGAESSVPSESVATPRVAVDNTAQSSSVVEEKASAQVAIADYAVAYDASTADLSTASKAGDDSPVLGRTVDQAGSDYDPRDTSLSLGTETTYPLPTETNITLPTDTSLSLPHGATEPLSEKADSAISENSVKNIAIAAGVAGTVGVAAALVAHNLSDKPDVPPTIARLEELAGELDGPETSEVISAKEIPREGAEPEVAPSNKPAEQAKAMESLQVDVDKAAPLSESFHVVEKDAPAQEEAAKGEEKKEASSEDGEESVARSAVVTTGGEETKTDEGSLVAPRPTTEGTGSAQQGDIVLDFRVPTPAVILPDLDDPVAQQLGRMRSLRRQRRKTIKQAEEMVAAAVVIYATAEVLSPPGSPRFSSPETSVLGSPEMHSGVKGKGKEAEVPIMSLQDSAGIEQDRGRARSRDLPEPVADLSVGDKEKIREPLKAEDSKLAHSSRRHSHHSSRHRSHRDSRDGSKEGSRRSHRSRSDSHASVRSRGEDEPPRTPNREDPGFGEHRSSPHSRRHRTPEEQAAHEKRKEERRRARELEKAKDGAPSSPASADKDKDRSATRERSERSSEHRHSHHRESRRHSQSRHSIEPKPSDVSVPPSPAASKKFFDIKNGQSVLEVNFGVGPRDTSASAGPPPTSSGSGSKTAVAGNSGQPPELRRSSTSRVRRSEERSSKEHRDRDRERERERERSKPSTTEQKATKASVASVGEAAAAGSSSSASGGDVDSQAHRAKRQEKRERAKEREAKEKGGLRAAIKRFFGSNA
ncbi:hypothetical protein VTI28DRAFT_1443 [Corynascus sepedonium]